ncbi:hypothetical protein SAMN02982929_07235 [Saccharopolyspora kobensis]|uniref:Uncharacterized protein n=1 Tax=Saccharopolyspora kobensis TaxID=146035 RepID=A0A1H6EQ82_9PSEU|nr:hypothetical protein [Saccharopolyspora kobensis]SEG98854.1 hypothetical protein SAMN02982929_07235 [Saccharopolyspora kobensis]SFD22800.1 hypothetical protein SAMN05216506_103143 [Saccharopolyspora kobensis]
MRFELSLFGYDIVRLYVGALEDGDAEEYVHAATLNTELSEGGRDDVPFGFAPAADTRR